MTKQDLNGLVLIGGKSSRMGEDKAFLRYRDRPQWQFCYELLELFCKDVFVSKRKEQELSWLRSDYFQAIDDVVEGAGPLGGILSAFQFDLQRSWLVVACDLPYLEIETIKVLVESRNVQQMATAYRSAYDSLPEPLCAIYEPKIYPYLKGSFDRHVYCPRKILMQLPVHLIDVKSKEWLDNINTPEERRKAQQCSPRSSI
ncbi:MAG: NTP transferase domain-containing protein [Candidatus Omnitrophica bacterium]|nr:NTP transferase domain-containing protein [Candidatus Omnitrophota bacterium]